MNSKNKKKKMPRVNNDWEQQQQAKLCQKCAGCAKDPKVNIYKKK